MHEILIYKNQPILKLSDTNIKYTKLYIGIKKALLIINNIDIIKSFIDANKIIVDTINTNNLKSNKLIDNKPIS